MEPSVYYIYAMKYVYNENGVGWIQFLCVQFSLRRTTKAVKTSSPRKIPPI